MVMEGASGSRMMVEGSEGAVKVYILDLEGFMGDVVGWDEPTYTLVPWKQGFRQGLEVVGSRGCV